MEKEFKVTVDVMEAESAVRVAYLRGMRKIEIEFFRGGPTDRATVWGSQENLLLLLDDWGYSEAQGFKVVQEADEQRLVVFPF